MRRQPRFLAALGIGVCKPRRSVWIEEGGDWSPQNRRKRIRVDDGLAAVKI